MGMALQFLTCPTCKQIMSSLVGPNWTVLPAPLAPGRSLVVLTCFKCNTVIGNYLVPDE
jgi:hypothetical protein